MTEMNPPTQDCTAFTATSAPTMLTPTDIAEMAAPDALTERGTQAFAVARQSGVAYNVAAEREYEAIAVLYLTADGERVVERWIPAGETPPRACLVAADDLDAAGPNARRFADALQAHPEAVQREDDSARLVTDGGVDTCAGCGTTLPETQPMGQPRGYCSVDCLLTKGDPLVGDAEVTPLLSEATRADLATQGDAPDRDILPDGGPSVVSVDGAESPVPPEYRDACERVGAEVREE